MKKRYIVLAAAAILAVLVAVPFAYAQHMRGAHRMHAMAAGPEMMLGHLQHAKAVLGLSDQQVADIKAIFTDLHTQNAAQREQLHGSLKSVAQILIANPNDIAAAQAQLEKQEAIEHAMKLNALNATAKALNVLTPEQRTTLSQKIEEHHGRFEK